jgi:hypothetical protein
MSIPKAPNELEIVRTTWNQFEIVLAGQNIPDSKPPKILMGNRIEHLGFSSSF